jgi:hypothetical protein
MVLLEIHDPCSAVHFVFKCFAAPNAAYLQTYDNLQESDPLNSHGPLHST